MPDLNVDPSHPMEMQRVPTLKNTTRNRPKRLVPRNLINQSINQYKSNQMKKNSENGKNTLNIFKKVTSLHIKKSIKKNTFLALTY
jgi:hypothetical protein